MAKILEEAVAYAMSKHSGQTRKCGEPYFWHLLRVTDMLNKEGFPETYQVVAVLHDTLEDTDATEEELRAKFGDEVTQAVKLLTKTEGCDLDKYIEDILADPIAREVKNADRLNNLWDCIHSGPIGTTRGSKAQRFAEGYVAETEKYFKGRFSRALDESIMWAKNLVLCREITSRQPWYVRSIKTYGPTEAPVKTEVAAPAPAEDNYRMLNLNEKTTYVVYREKVYVSNFRDEDEPHEAWELTPKGWKPADPFIDFADDKIYEDCHELSLKGLKRFLDEGNELNVFVKYLP